MSLALDGRMPAGAAAEMATPATPIRRSCIVYIFLTYVGQQCPVTATFGPIGAMP